MCIKAVEDEPDVIEYVTDHFKTEEMCEKAAEDDAWKLRFVLDYFKTRNICDVWRGEISLICSLYLTGL